MYKNRYKPITYGGLEPPSSDLYRITLQYYICASNITFYILKFLLDVTFTPKSGPVSPVFHIVLHSAVY